MHNPARAFALASALLITVALVMLHPRGEPGVTMRDFEAYYSAGATWLAHHNPYSFEIWKTELQIPGVVASRHELLPFVGVPATLPLWGAFSRLPYAQATVAWSALLVVALATIVIAVHRLFSLNRMQTILATLVALSFVPITSDFGLGQAALAAYACALLALVLPYALAPVAAAAAVLQPNVALGLGVLLYSRRTMLQLVVAAMIVGVVARFSLGSRWLPVYASVLAAHAGAEHAATIQYAPAAVLYGFGLDARTSDAVAAIVGALVFLIALRTLRIDSTARQFSVVCCAIPFVSGFFHEHDFVVLFVPAVFALVHGRFPWLATFAVVLAGVNWLDFAQQPQALAQDVTLAAALICACVALRPIRGQWLGAALGAGAVVLGAVIGATHPLPIWPNDMQGIPHGATVAELWKNEQLQTGLMRPDAAVALLRCFALLGSVLLFYLNLDVDVHHVVERRDGVRVEVL